MKKNNLLAVLAAMLFLVISCKKDNPVVTPPLTEIHLDSNATVGVHIVDKDGRSLYLFSNDANGLSNCTGGCLTTWPIFLADSTNTTYSNGLAASDFKTITATSGDKQTTYKGWPLYYYTPGGVPEAAGQTTGEGIEGIWFVAKMNYSVMIANNQLIGGNGINYLNDYSPGDGRSVYLTDGNGNTLYTFA